MASPIIPFEKRTVFDGQGRGDIGFVTDAVANTIGCNVGPIRLLNGLQGRNGGFGLAHLDHHTSRMKQIAGMGFRNAHDYVRFIAADYDRIASQEDSSRLLFLREKSGINHRLVCQWETDFWSVTTAIPKTGVGDLQIVWEKTTA